MEERIQQLEEAVASIQARNTRVEADKAWELSWARVFAIGLCTYSVAAVLLAAMGSQHIFAAAAVPALGFYVSTRSLNFFKRTWMATYSKKRENSGRHPDI